VLDISQNLQFKAVRDQYTLSSK